ncbi:DUF1330 domain-containing protein [Bordetella tumulicola]
MAGLRILSLNPMFILNTEIGMPAYAIGLLRDVDFNAEIIEYVSNIEDTMKPFGGRFLVHGTHAEIIEGTMNDDCVIIEFPSIDQAQQWYASPAYRKLIPLRTCNSKGAVFLVDGVSDNYSALSLVEKMAAST